MGSQSVTQAVVVEQEAPVPNQGSLLLALFNPDGTPYVPLTVPTDEQGNLLLDGGTP